MINQNFSKVHFSSMLMKQQHTGSQLTRDISTENESF